MMITKDTQFSAAKAFLHWYLLTCAGLLVGGGALMLLAERSPLLIFGKGNELFSGVVGIAGLAWVVWTAWYIGHRDGYTKRVKPIPHCSLFAYYGERTMDVIGAVAVATLAAGAAAGCCCDDDDFPYGK
ncbi:MAG: hypothetical protein Q8Q28_18135 [Pseudomonadota bacterium]|nr:hypothetical protein [Pseudomonadota bacterium]